MRRIQSRRAAALGTLVALSALIGAGPAKRKPTVLPREPLKVEETIGNIAYFQHSGEIEVHGVGLVVGLDNTGSDPEPSYERQKLLDEMRKAGVENADRILASPSTSLVLVRTRIPAGVSTRDKLDVELTLTASSTTKSLAGGWLINTDLTEVMMGKDGAHEGNVMATAGGPVMIGSSERPDDPKFGRVLGGSRVKKDMPHSIVIHENRKSVKTAQLIRDVINGRFHQHEGIDNAGMATAKTDEYLTLKVPRIYHHNQDHYFRVLKLLPVLNAPNLQAQRLERWGKELLDPETAGISALRLEGVGPNAAEVLKKGLASDNDQVRFFAAEALAYLDEVEGADVLAETAIRRPEFRLYALAALSAMDHPGATLRLRKLMDQADVQLRYGAFDALRTKDPLDPFLGRVAVLGRDEPEEADASSMAMAIATGGPRRRGGGRPDDPFSLYIVDSEGPPLVHVSGSRRCEIVIFGGNQRLLTPLVLGNGGAILLNASEGDRQVQISHISPGSLDGAERKVSCPAELGEVVRQTAQLGATYPEIVAILAAADRQKNLPGPLVIDALPGATEEYQKALLAGADATSKKDDEVEKTAAESESSKRPGLFERIRNLRR